MATVVGQSRCTERPFTSTLGPRRILVVLVAVTALEIVTLVVAILGVTLGFGSLAWQAATFVLSGSRVRLRL